jgi:hypothetical protein
MIIDKEIEIKVNPNSRIYYNNIGYKCENYELLKIKTIDLPSGSNILIKIECDNCGDIKILKFNKYYKSTNKLKEEYFCKKCNFIKIKKTKLERYGDENYTNRDKAKETCLEKYGDENYTNRDKAKETCLEKFGVDNISKLGEVKEKKKEKFIKKYGVENPFQSQEVKKKIKETCLQKYNSEYYITSKDAKDKYELFCDRLGVEHYSKSNEFKEKFEETCLLRWGKTTNLLNNNIKEKIKQTNLEKYGFDHAMKKKDISVLNAKRIIDSRYDYFLKLGYEYIEYDYNKHLYKLKNIKCGHIFEINYDLFRSRIKYNNNSCLICYPKQELSSIKEKEIANWLNSLNINLIENDRSLINPQELDIYLPEFKLAIEFNGLYYHSDKFKEKNYHINKTNECNKLGIQLIHIWEDDWVYKKEIIKSIILNRLGLVNNKIYARKTTIKEVDTKESREFLNKNHIQGYTTSSIKIGLFYDNELVSLMTFGNRRINSKNNYELIRFSNKLNTNVIGGASKIFKYFITNYSETKIVSYSDISLFSGDLYEKLGFTNDGKTNLNYYWTDLNVKYHRFNFNKKKLVKLGHDHDLTEDEIMKNIGYHKIWSCGQIRWLYNSEN